MSEKNIWGTMEFSLGKQKSAFDYLREQAKFLVNATKGELRMEVTAADGYVEEDSLKLAAIYTLYVVAPKLGNFRRKILTVAEYATAGRYPVTIIVNIDGNEKISGVTEENFITEVEKILSRPLIKISIQNLFIQSKEIKNDYGLMQEVFTIDKTTFDFNRQGAFEGEFISSNKPISRTPPLTYSINVGEQIPILGNLHNINPQSTEFDIFEEQKFTLSLNNLLPGETIVLNYRIVEAPLFF